MFADKLNIVRSLTYPEIPAKAGTTNTPFFGDSNRLFQVIDGEKNPALNKAGNMLIINYMAVSV